MWPHLESRIESHPGGRKSASGSVYASSAEAKKKGSHGGQHSRCVIVHRLLFIFIFSFAGWYAFPFLDQ